MIGIIFGPPGSGKGTQAARIEKEFHLAHLSTGAILRAEVARGTEIGKEAGRIMAAGRPEKVVWFNCMTWLFDGEREAHRQGWIDVFGFVSAYQRRYLTPQLEAIRPGVASFDYRPYFDSSSIEWQYRPWDGCYRLGRISRDDMHKFAADTWQFSRWNVPLSRTPCANG